MAIENLYLELVGIFTKLDAAYGMEYSSVNLDELLPRVALVI